jgi:hypothetical protein
MKMYLGSKLRSGLQCVSSIGRFIEHEGFLFSECPRLLPKRQSCACARLKNKILVLNYNALYGNHSTIAHLVCKARNENFGQIKANWKFSPKFTKSGTFAKQTKISRLSMAKIKSCICSMNRPQVSVLD